MFVADASETLRNRLEKSAAALLAIEQTLREERPLLGAEAGFLGVLSALRRVPVESFSDVWRDPAAYYWVRMGYQLLAHVQGAAPLEALGQRHVDVLGVSPADALVRHLEEFSLFLVAAWMHTGTDARLKEPARISLPASLPGTEWSLHGAGTAHLLGAQGGGAIVARQASEANADPAAGTCEAPRVNRCNIVKVGDARVRLQPDLFLGLPALGLDEALRDAGPAYQARHAPLLARAFTLMERHHPGAFSELRATLQVVALKPLFAGGFSNLTHSDLPGAFVAGVIENPHEMADTFIHELGHNRLFNQEEAGPFFQETEPHPTLACDFYSPWRDDRRPLHGILHGAYVYSSVGEYWSSVLEAGGERWLMDYAAERVLRGTLQLRLAMAELRQHAHPSPRGRTLLEKMSQSHAALERRTPSLRADEHPALRCTEAGAIVPESPDGSAPMTVFSAVEQHVQRYARPERVNELLRALAPTER